MSTLSIRILSDEKSEAAMVSRMPRDASGARRIAGTRAGSACDTRLRRQPR
jgi:hypothetical protein